MADGPTEGPVFCPLSPRSRTARRTAEHRRRTRGGDIARFLPTPVFPTQTLEASGGGTPARARGGDNGVRWGGGHIWLGRLLGFTLLFSFLAALGILNTKF